MAQEQKPSIWKKRLARRSAYFLGTIVLLLGCLSAIQAILTPLEKQRIPAPGSLVEVDGHKMHIYTQGEGDTTYVLLSGGGVAVPVLEYKPLWSKLSKHGRVAVVEYFGYGWSDSTDAPRTAENVVEEIREGLRKAGIAPPYVLVPHSMSGIYALQYAQSYPDELRAIIALDTTLPRSLIQAKKDNLSMPSVGLLPVLRQTGILRAALWFHPLLVSGAPAGTYSKEDARTIATVTSWNYANATLENEFQTIESNMTALLDAGFPKQLPVLMIQAAPPDQLGEYYQWAVQERRRMTQTLDSGKVVELPAGHSGIYWKLSDRIVEETLQFLDTVQP